MHIEAITTSSDIESQAEASALTGSFSLILDSFGLSYVNDGIYWKVGELKQIQGWILHISVTLKQVDKLIHSIVPILAGVKVAFKIVKNLDVAYGNLNGYSGASQLGKLISIYPEDDRQAISLVKMLQPHTRMFSGPAVLTDFSLGYNIYVRYGSHIGIERRNALGNIDRLIYNQDGQLVSDEYHIPFRRPKNVNWPFAEFGDPPVKIQSRILNGRYIITNTLKEDIKGNVFRARYFNNYLIVKPCVIKQGKANMLVDQNGRDIRTRLAWQKELHSILNGIVPIPKVLDLFRKEEDDYLVLQFIKGRELYKHLNTLNSKGEAWLYLPRKVRQRIFYYITQLLEIISRLHEHGIVHRDITPVNFMVLKSDRLMLIDIELAYSINKKYPNPPFEVGTVGFMSPEQERALVPTEKEDTYGLAATLLTILTGVPPGIFLPCDPKLIENVLFFVQDVTVSETLAASLSSLPSERPRLSDIALVLSNYEHQSFDNSYNTTDDLFFEKINDTINAGIRGLVSEPMPMKDGLWYSFRSEDDRLPYSHKRFFTRAPGLHQGIAGTLYFLAKAKMAGCNIDVCKEAFALNWGYLKDLATKNDDKLPAGLYVGRAGIAMALTAGMKAGLLPNDNVNRSFIQSCLASKITDLNLATGITGLGAVALQADQFISMQFKKELYGKHLDMLLKAQHKDGFWIHFRRSKGRKEPVTSLAYGNSAIILYLLEIGRVLHEPEAMEIASKTFAIYQAAASKLEADIRRNGYRRVLTSLAFPDTIAGIVAVLRMAYEIFNKSSYRSSIERLLQSFPETLVHENYTQESGIVGIGELYLDAYLITDDKKYLNRARWIAELLVHTSVAGEEASRHWLINNAISPTADLLTGSCGVLHFLMRVMNPKVALSRLLW